MAGIVTRQGQANLQVKLQNSKVVHRHADQVRGRNYIAPHDLPNIEFDDLVDSVSDPTSGEPQ